MSAHRKHPRHRCDLERLKPTRCQCIVPKLYKTKHGPWCAICLLPAPSVHTERVIIGGRTVAEITAEMLAQPARAGGTPEVA